MQIVAISPSRRSNQFWLKFDDKSFLPIKADDVINLKLRKFVDLSDDLYQSTLDKSANFLISEYSLRQIAISPKVEPLLRQKIKLFCQKISQKYHYSPAILSSQTELVINYLNSQNLLNQQEYLDYLVRRYPKKSVTELNFKLKSLGINLSIPVSRSEELFKIKDLLIKKYKSVDLTDYSAKGKVIAKLYRQGFALDLIKTTIDEHLKIR